MTDHYQQLTYDTTVLTPTVNLTITLKNIRKKIFKKVVNYVKNQVYQRNKVNIPSVKYHQSSGFLNCSCLCQQLIRIPRVIGQDSQHVCALQYLNGMLCFYK